jgi:hypothetical protein
MLAKPLLVLLLVLLSAIPVFYVSSFLHELGHALCGRVAGFAVSSFGMGVGRPFWTTTWRGVRVYLCLRRPFQGLTFVSYARLFPTRWQWTCFFAGGIVTHVVLTAAALALCWLAPGVWGFWVMTAFLNALLALSNSIPFSFRVGKMTLRSDGALLLRTWLYGRPTDRDDTTALRTLKQLRGHWDATSDPAMRRGYLLHAVSVWVSLGDAEYAGQLLKEALARPVALALEARGHPAVVAALTALAENNPARAAGWLDEAELWLRQAENPGVEFLVRVARGELLLCRGEIDEALRTLDELASHPLAGKRGPLHTDVLVARLAARCALPDGDGLDALLSEYEKTPARRRSAMADLQLYPTLAGFFRRREEVSRTLAAYASALDAGRRLDEGLSDPEDRARFRRCRAALVEEARDYFRQAGRSEEAAKLADTFPAYEARKRQAEERRRRNEARCLRAGVVLLLVNVAAAAVVFAALTGLAGQELPMPALMLFVCLVAFSALGVVYAIVGWVWHLLHPATARGRGIGLLILEVVPWLLWLLTALLWAGK